MERTKKDKLIRLIKSMNKSEKRYFRLYSNFYSGKEKSYMILFDLIDEKGITEDAKLERFIRAKNIKTPLTNLKNYLYSRIMDALVANEEDSEQIITFFNYIKKILILFRKQLYEDAWAILKQLKKFNEERSYVYTTHMYVLEINLLLRMLKDRRGIAQEIVKTTTKWIKEENDLLTYINILQYHYQSVLLTTDNEQKDEIIEQELEKIIGKVNAYSNDKIDNFYIKLKHLNILGLLYDTKEMYDMSFPLLEKAFLLAMDNKKDELQIITCWDNYLLACLNANERSKFKNLIYMFDERKFEHKDTLYKWEAHKIYWIALYGTILLDADFVVKHIPYIKTVIERYKKQGLTLYNERVLYTNLSIVFMIKRQYDKALDWLNRYVLIENVAIEDIDFISLLMLELIYQIELGAYGYVQSRIEAIIRQMRRKKILNEEVFQTLNSFKKINKILMNDYPDSDDLIVKEKDYLYDCIMNAKDIAIKRGQPMLKIWITYSKTFA